MSPRSLTEHEKDSQYQKIIQKGKELLFLYGMQKTSVDDIVKAAGIAKGTFYVHFKSKEDFLYKVVPQIHWHHYEETERLFKEKSEIPLKERLRTFLKDMFSSPEFLFFLKYHDELDALIEKMSSKEIGTLKESECVVYERLLKLIQVDTEVVKPGVVHNYIHAIYLGIWDKDLMIMDYLDETHDVLINGLLEYIFGGEK